eukprot:CAMPEP_0167754960 /NCGR_PEP_ID=MMETSP0110_2-20121227/8561_1 /TAXON_ID=629695 /ORGANISM="Gymnochlora sp., Strain CCMP2014" /LENGTH=318 /DNA_ID=CAMNT_0007640899 /DNA_START=99 /DNA_END=1054 /DNA_ORIENTATION=-
MSLFSTIEAISEDYVMALYQAPKFAKVRFKPMHFSSPGVDKKSDIQSTYNAICRKIHSLAINSLSNTAKKAVLNYNVTQGDGISLLRALELEYGGGKCIGGLQPFFHLLDVKLEGCKNLDDYSYKFKTAYDSVVSALQADPKEPIKALPKMIVVALYLRRLGPNYSTIASIINDGPIKGIDAVEALQLVQARVRAHEAQIMTDVKPSVPPQTQYDALLPVGTADRKTIFITPAIKLVLPVVVLIKETKLPSHKKKNATGRPQNNKDRRAAQADAKNAVQAKLLKEKERKEIASLVTSTVKEILSQRPVRSSNDEYDDV